MIKTDNKIYPQSDLPNHDQSGRIKYLGNQSSVESHISGETRSNIKLLPNQLGLLLIGILFLLLLLIKFKNFGWYRTIMTNSLCSNYPCFGCKYFHNNDYLKCAVEPGKVLTENAINCSEYTPKNS